MKLDKLNREISNSGIKKKSIALKLGITEISLIRKLKGETEFKISETVKIGNILNLSNDQKCAIFFSE